MFSLSNGLVPKRLILWSTLHVTWFTPEFSFEANQLVAFAYNLDAELSLPCSRDYSVQENKERNCAKFCLLHPALAYKAYADSSDFLHGRKIDAYLLHMFNVIPETQKYHF